MYDFYNNAVHLLLKCRTSFVKLLYIFLKTNKDELKNLSLGIENTIKTS